MKNTSANCFNPFANTLIESFFESVNFFFQRNLNSSKFSKNLTPNFSEPIISVVDHFRTDRERCFITIIFYRTNIPLANRETRGSSVSMAKATRLLQSTSIDMPYISDARNERIKKRNERAELARQQGSEKRAGKKTEET